MVAEESDRESILATRHGLGLNRRDFARLSGFSERAIARWESGDRLSEQSRQRMREIRSLQQELFELMEPAAIRRWLLSPNPNFNDLKPLEVIERGGVHHVWRTIFRLQEGAAG